MKHEQMEEDIIAKFLLKYKSNQWLTPKRKSLVRKANAEMTIEEWIHFATTAAEEAEAEQVEVSGKDRATAGRDAYNANLPPLSSRQTTKAYIACVAAGIRLGYIEPLEAKQMMYVAQVMLQALGKPSAAADTPLPPAPRSNKQGGDKKRK